jgi:hypothetical protein
MRLQNLTTEMMLHYEVSEVTFRNLIVFENNATSERNFQNSVSVFQPLRLCSLSSDFGFYNPKNRGHFRFLFGGFKSNEGAKRTIFLMLPTFISPNHQTIVIHDHCILTSPHFLPSLFGENCYLHLLTCY